MMSDRYNGWSNYQTWVTALWLDNNEGSYYYVLEMARNSSSVGVLADALRERHEEFMPETAGVYADLLTHALGMVDWYEIAEHYEEDIEEE